MQRQIIYFLLIPAIFIQCSTKNDKQQNVVLHIDEYNTKVHIQIQPTNNSNEQICNIKVSHNGLINQTINDSIFLEEQPFVFFEDITNNGIEDLLIECFRPGRGSNTICNLYCFEKKSKKLKKIINADYYPNLHFDTTLKKIYSIRFYGDESYIHYLKLNGDSLKEEYNINISNDSLKFYKVENDIEILKETKKINRNCIIPEIKCLEPLEIDIECG